ncbi:MAG TPA: NADPH:quinone oxidoreductase family protein [Acidimicrobiia bacterium]
MRAARCQAYGPPEAVVIEHIPPPTLRAGGALIDIQAAAVNFPDVLLVANEYQVSIPVPFTLGSEFAGVVTAVADDATGLAPGDRVFGSAFAGAFAEQIAMPAAALTRLPDSADFAEAAAFGVAHTTAYLALRSVAEVQADDWVVVLGAAGGVGLAAVELATILGARVVAAASSADKLALCRARGAVATVNYTTEDLKVRIKDITGGGADVVIDPVGGPYSEPALRATRWGGRFVVIGFAAGEIPRIPLNLVLLKGVVVKGFEFRTFADHAPDAARRDHDELFQLFATGQVRPHVSAVFPLDQTGEALRAMADRRALGKIVVDPTA